MIRNIMICCMFFFGFSILCGTDTVEAKKMTSAEQAKNAALKKIPSATVIKMESDHDDGVLVYEIELLKAGKEHNFESRRKIAPIRLGNSESASSESEQEKFVQKSHSEKGTW